MVFGMDAGDADVEVVVVAGLDGERIISAFSVENVGVALDDELVASRAPL